MARPTDVKARETELRAWSLRQQGYTQEQIAAELGVGSSAISRALSRLSKRYLDTMLAEIGEVKAQQIARLEHIASEAMAAWEASKKMRRSVTKRTTHHLVRARLDGTPTSFPLEDITANSAEQTGDPRYLLVAMKAFEDIRAILGLDKPLLDSPTSSEVTGNVVRVREILNVPDETGEPAPTEAQPSKGLVEQSETITISSEPAGDEEETE